MKDRDADLLASVTLEDLVVIAGGGIGGSGPAHCRLMVTWQECEREWSICREMGEEGMVW